jgi:hypothetical protein
MSDNFLFGSPVLFGSSTTPGVPIPEELQSISDYCIFDKNNILTKHTFFNSSWYSSENFDNYINLASDFNIKINYMCNSNYNISIERKKQLVQNNEDENGSSSLTCENIYDLLIQEIQKRATNKEINYEL